MGQGAKLCLYMDCQEDRSRGIPRDKGSVQLLILP